MLREGRWIVEVGVSGEGGVWGWVVVGVGGGVWWWGGDVGFGDVG